MNRKWDTSSKETNRKCADEILARIEEQGDSPFGMIAAEDIIEIVKLNLAADIYNSAISDVKKTLQNRLADMETEIDMLEQR